MASGVEESEVYTHLDVGNLDFVIQEFGCALQPKGKMVKVMVRAFYELRILV